MAPDEDFEINGVQNLLVVRVDGAGRWGLATVG